MRIRKNVCIITEEIRIEMTIQTKYHKTRSQSGGGRTPLFIFGENPMKGMIKK